jgi:hypothetical protein
MPLKRAAKKRKKIRMTRNENDFLLKEVQSNINYDSKNKSQIFSLIVFSLLLLLTDFRISPAVFKKE